MGRSVLETVDPIEEYRKRGVLPPGIDREMIDRLTDQVIKELGGDRFSISTLSSDIPPRLSKRPIFHGMVVPYVAELDQAGKPLFAVIDESKRFEVAEKHLCGVCGGHLDYWISFIGGPRSMLTRMFIDAPMHHQCAIYSLAVCPYLRHAPGTNPATLAEPLNVVQDRAKKRLGHDQVANFDIVQEGRPDLMGLYVTRGFKFGLYKRSPLDQANYVFLARPSAKITWYEGVQ